MNKLWGGRFSEKTNPIVENFTSSLELDKRLWLADLKATQAHVRMLGKSQILSEDDCEVILNALKELQSLPSMPSISAEDIHSVIEILLFEKIGDLAKKIHTARSRNDQVVTATRLYLKDEAQTLIIKISQLKKWFLETAKNHTETILPGLTHLQHAQPVSLAHHLLAYFWMFHRDQNRLKDCLKRINELPLGSAALAGTSFPIDRQMVAQELEFESILENSLDAVSDRDFIIEFLSCCSLIMVHLSRLSEELILWSTPEFGFIELHDSVTTGSSIMPQKKNPDVAELIRGRSAVVIASLTGALTLLKGLALSYNRDLQEDKRFLFQGLDITRSCTELMHFMLTQTEFNTKKMQNALKNDFSNATDLADYLAKKNLPFRDAHHITGQIVQYCLREKKSLEALSLNELIKFSPLFTQEVLEIISHKNVLHSRTSQGGTSPQAVQKQIEKAIKLST